MPSWSTESLRFTLFFDPKTGPNGSDWWEVLTAEKPIYSLRKPQFQDMGPYGHGSLLVNVFQNRADLYYLAKPDETSDELATIGSFEESLTTFMALAHKWLGFDLPPVMRTAFGAVLIERVRNKEAGYKQLAGLLPSLRELDGESSSEFLYQINRPRNSTVIKGMIINRLSKWSVVAIQSYSVSVENQSQLQPTVQSKQPIDACRLELDINSAESNRTAMTREQLNAMFDELAAMAVEIAQKGDLK